MRLSCDVAVWLGILGGCLFGVILGVYFERWRQLGKP